MNDSSASRNSSASTSPERSRSATEKRWLAVSQTSTIPGRGFSWRYLRANRNQESSSRLQGTAPRLRHGGTHCRHPVRCLRGQRAVSHLTISSRLIVPLLSSSSCTRQHHSEAFDGVSTWQSTSPQAQATGMCSGGLSPATCPKRCCNSASMFATRDISMSFFRATAPR
jgi:hypothetical protein